MSCQFSRGALLTYFPSMSLLFCFPQLFPPIISKLVPYYFPTNSQLVPYNVLHISSNYFTNYFPIMSRFVPHHLPNYVISPFFLYSVPTLPKLCPNYFPIISPIISLLFPFYYFPSTLLFPLSPQLFPTDFPFHMWIYVDSHDMPILSVRAYMAYIIPINCWFNQRDSHWPCFFFRQVWWVLLLGPRQAGRVQENRTAEVSDDQSWCFIK